MSGLRILADATNTPKNGVNRQGKAYWRPHHEGQELLKAVDRLILSYPGGNSSRYRGDRLLQFERERDAWLKSSERRSIKDHAMARIIAELKSKNFPDHFLEPRYLHDKIQLCLDTRMVDEQRKTASSDARRFPSSRDPDDISRSTQSRELPAHLLQLNRIRDALKKIQTEFGRLSNDIHVTEEASAWGESNFKSLQVLLTDTTRVEVVLGCQDRVLLMRDISSLKEKLLTHFVGFAWVRAEIVSTASADVRVQNFSRPFESQASAVSAVANEVIGAEPKRRRTAKNWDGDNDKAREHATAVSWLQSFKSKLSGLRHELQMRVRLIDPTKIKRTTELCWCYLTWSGHFITCDNPIWKLNFGILLAAMRDALKLPCLPEHKRPLVWFKLAVRMLTLENRFQRANGTDEAAMMGVMGSVESPNRVRRSFTA